MSRASLIRDAGRPQSAEDREAILRELEDVLASPHFCNSKRYPALLRYIVENTLAGRSDQLKERTIGVEVFERPASYDTNADTVVRYTAGEVRKRLSLYYHELGRRPAVQISLPPGSYVPEFLHPLGETDEDANGRHDLALPEPPPRRRELAGAQLGEGIPARSRMSWAWVLAAAVLIAALAAAAWQYRSAPPRTPVDAFWAPLLKDQHAVLVCSGGTVFKPDNFSGVGTAGKNADYPFVSGQIATSIARVSALVARSGATMDMEFSATTPLTTLTDQPVILLGGYNNLWTLRLLDPLPLHFSPEADASIVDAAHPEVHWARDRSQPYSSADDYALIARFRDQTTGSWVVVLAGLGRNGTEAAAQFATTPKYMQALRDEAKKDFVDRNVEAVLKVNVIEGKTGAPSILAVRVW